MFDVIANIAGIISLILGIVTLVTAVGIRKSFLQHIEKSDYIEDIDNQINELLSYYETLLYDSSLYDENLLQKIDLALQDILIQYETILPNKFLNEIKDVRKLIEEKCTVDLNDEDAKYQCTRSIKAICLRLKKEKKLL